MTKDLEKILKNCGKSISLLSIDELNDFFFEFNQDYITSMIKKEIVKNLPCDSTFVKKLLYGIRILKLEKKLF